MGPLKLKASVAGDGDSQTLTLAHVEQTDDYYAQRQALAESRRSAAQARRQELRDLQCQIDQEMDKVSRIIGEQVLESDVKEASDEITRLLLLKGKQQHEHDKLEQDKDLQVSYTQQSATTSVVLHPGIWTHVPWTDDLVMWCKPAQYSFQEEDKPMVRLFDED